MCVGDHIMTIILFRNIFIDILFGCFLSHKNDGFSFSFLRTLWVLRCYVICTMNCGCYIAWAPWVNGMMSPILWKHDDMADQVKIKTGRIPFTLNILVLPMSIIPNVKANQYWPVSSHCLIELTLHYNFVSLSVLCLVEVTSVNNKKGEVKSSKLTHRKSPPTAFVTTTTAAVIVL